MTRELNHCSCLSLWYYWLLIQYANLLVLAFEEINKMSLRIYIFNKINTPKITAKDIGNGNKKEIVRLIPKDIPSQTNWLSRNCSLLLMFNLDSHSSILLLYSF